MRNAKGADVTADDALIAELQALGVAGDVDATLPEVVAALQAQIVRAVSSPPADLDRPRYDALMRQRKRRPNERSA